MTVAIVSVGYDGTVDETQWANLIGKAGSSEYGVDLAGDFGVTPVAGQDRTVRVAPGKAWGHGVLDVMDVEQTLQFALPASGNRYDMIVLRRDWQPPGGATSLAIVEGSASSVTLPARNTGSLGILDDQPIALVRVSAGSTSVSVTADLRVWARNGGATAKHTHALQYLGALGALVEIDGILWQRRVGSTGAEWVRAADFNPAVVAACPLRVGVSGTLQGSVKDGLVVVDGRLTIPATQPGTVRQLGWLPAGIPAPTSYTRYGAGATIQNQPLVARLTPDGDIEVINRTSSAQVSASVSFTYRA